MGINKLPVYSYAASRVTQPISYFLSISSAG